MRRIDASVQKQKELDLLVRKGSVEQGAAKRLRDDYIREMLKATEEFFDAEQKLEDLRAEIKVDIQQRKRNSADTSELEQTVNSIEEAYMSVDPKVWVEIAVSTLATFISAWRRGEIDEERFKGMREIYKRFLDSMTEKWDYQKKSLEDNLGKLEEEVNKKEQQLKEITVRFKVGEYDKREYDALSLPISLELDQLRAKEEKISGYIDIIDSAIFDCYYLYSHPEEKKEPDFEVMISALNIPSAEEIIGSTIKGENIQEMYDKLFNYYSLNVGPDRAKVRLERELSRYAGQGMSRSDAIRAVYKAVMGD